MQTIIFKNGYFSIVIVILPVSVIILHLPPSVLSGTLTLPVSVVAKITLFVRKLPLTSPVSVVTEISNASHLSKVTSPVLLSLSNLPSEITERRLSSPLEPL